MYYTSGTHLTIVKLQLFYAFCIFQRHYNQLREEFAKAKPPSGLEDIESEEIDPKEKHYQTDQSGASGSKESTPGPQIFPADNNANSVINPEDIPHITAADC